MRLYGTRRKMNRSERTFVLKLFAYVQREGRFSGLKSGIQARRPHESPMEPAFVPATECMSSVKSFYLLAFSMAF